MAGSVGKAQRAAYARGRTAVASRPLAVGETLVRVGPKSAGKGGWVARRYSFAMQ